MNSLRDFFLTLLLAAIFVLLSVFSVIEYKDGEAGTDQKDKSPAVRAVLDKAVNIFSFLEKMPLLRFLPAGQFAENYNSSMIEVLDPLKETKSNYSGKLAENVLSVKDADCLFNPNISLNQRINNYWLFLKEKMTEKDWSPL